MFIKFTDNFRIAYEASNDTIQQNVENALKILQKLPKERYKFVSDFTQPCTKLKLSPIAPESQSLLSDERTIDNIADFKNFIALNKNDILPLLSREERKMLLVNSAGFGFIGAGIGLFTPIVLMILVLPVLAFCLLFKIPVEWISTVYNIIFPGLTFTSSSSPGWSIGGGLFGWTVLGTTVGASLPVGVKLINQFRNGSDSSNLNRLENELPEQRDENNPELDPENNKNECVIDNKEKINLLKNGSYKVVHLKNLDAATVKEVIKNLPKNTKELVLDGLGKDALEAVHASIKENLQLTTLRFENLQADHKTAEIITNLCAISYIINLAFGKMQSVIPINWDTVQLYDGMNEKHIYITPDNAPQVTAPFLGQIPENIFLIKTIKLLKGYPESTVLLSLKNNLFKNILTQQQHSDIVSFEFNENTFNSDTKISKHYCNNLDYSIEKVFPEISKSEKSKKNENKFDDFLIKTNREVRSEKPKDALKSLFSFTKSFEQVEENKVEIIIRRALYLLDDKTLKNTLSILPNNSINYLFLLHKIAECICAENENKKWGQSREKLLEIISARLEDEPDNNTLKATNTLLSLFKSNKIATADKLEFLNNIGNGGKKKPKEEKKKEGIIEIVIEKIEEKTENKFS